MSVIKFSDDSTGTLLKYTFAEWVQLVMGVSFVATLTSEMRVNSYFLFGFLFSLLFTFRLSNLVNYRGPVIIFTSGFLFSLIGVSWSENASEGYLVVERQLGLFFLPVMFFSSFRPSARKLQMLMAAYYASVVLVSAYLMICAYKNYEASGLPLKQWTVKENLYHAFAKPVDMHAIYLSLYLALAIFFGFHWFLVNKRVWINIVLFLTMLLLAATLTFLSSRVVISSLVIILFTAYPFFIGRIRHKGVLMVAGGAIVFILFLLIRESSFITDRFTDKIEDEVQMTPFLKADSTYNPVYGGETRADRWFCAVELIREKPLLGYGTGSEKDVLMQKYVKYNLQNAQVNHYDAHNQYLAYAIKGGIPALVLFLLTIVYGISVGIKSRNFVYLAFLILFVITCITENVLESNKGIFFYAFFNSVFCLHCMAIGRTGPQKKDNA